MKCVVPIGFQIQIRIQIRFHSALQSGQKCRHKRRSSMQHADSLGLRCFFVDADAYAACRPCFQTWKFVFRLSYIRFVFLFRFPLRWTICRHALRCCFNYTLQGLPSGGLLVRTQAHLDAWLRQCTCSFRCTCIFTCARAD